MMVVKSCSLATLRRFFKGLGTFLVKTELAGFQ
jgi:hypothetical protein